MGKIGVLENPFITVGNEDKDVVVSGDINTLIEQLFLGQLERIICSEGAISEEVEVKLYTKGIKQESSFTFQKNSFYILVKQSANTLNSLVANCCLSCPIAQNANKNKVLPDCFGCC